MARIYSIADLIPKGSVVRTGDFKFDDRKSPPVVYKVDAIKYVADELREILPNPNQSSVEEALQVLTANKPYHRRVASVANNPKNTIDSEKAFRVGNGRVPLFPLVEQALAKLQSPTVEVQTKTSQSAEEEVLEACTGK